MNQNELQQKLEQASQHYNDSDYDKAAAVWKDILETDPQNERAREGLQMVELLTQDFREPTSAPLAPDTVQVQQAVKRVQELLDAGETDAAREGVEVLLQIAPDDAEVQQCSARLEAGADPAAYAAEQLSLARHYVMMDDRPAGMEACRRVLSVDPDNDEAKELLSQASGSTATSSPSMAGPPAPTSQPRTDAPAEGQPLEDDDLLTFDLDSLEDVGEPPAAPEALTAEPLPLAQAPETPSGEENAAERIAALLGQGDALQAQGDLQGAIQVWSRVFVLQDTHAEAEERVTRARSVLEEQAVRVDEIRFRAEDLLNAGSFAEAREEYQKILEILPQHQEALDALKQIETQLAGSTEPAASGEGKEIQSVPLAMPEQPQEPVGQEPEPEESVLLEPQSQTPPPAPQAAAPAAAPARRRPGRGQVLSVVAVGVVVLCMAGYVGWGILFPSKPLGELPGLEPQALDRTSTAKAAAQPLVEPVPVEPEQTEVLVATAPRPVVLDDEEVRGLARQAVEEAARLFDQGEFVQALQQFRAALELDPGNVDAKDWETRTAAEVERRELFQREVATIRTALEDYDYESALKKLYRMEAPTEEGEAMVHRWKVTCWYNWGVLRLRGARLREAEEKFREVVELQPDDEEAVNHLEVVRRYRGRAVDASFKNYTDRLTLRELE